MASRSSSTLSTLHLLGLSSITRLLRVEADSPNYFAADNESTGQLALVGTRIGLPLSSMPVISFPLTVVDPVPVSDPFACKVK